MKKILCVTFFLLAGIVSTWAQNFSVGARVGLNIALTSAGSGTGSSVPSIMAGVFVKVMFTGKVGIQPELFYNSIGAKDNYPLPFGTITTTTNYLSLPFFFRYNVVPHFHLLAGPQVGILLSAKQTFNFGSIDVKDQLNSSDIGGAIGAGGDFGRFDGGIRYNFGFSNIYNDGSGSSAKNKIFQIVVGFKIFGK